MGYPITKYVLICEECGLVITQENFWEHKHKTYVFREVVRNDKMVKSKGETKSKSSVD